MTTIRNTEFACLLVLFGGICFAEENDWPSGTAAYASGDYELALKHFQSARRDGLDGPAVHYNIAVCHFQLGQFEQSRAEFQLIADRYREMRGLAEYNLGLIARRRNDTGAARGHFLLAYKLSPDDEKLRILASNRLREIEPELQLASRWTGAAGIRAGYDDNVALRDETGLPSGASSDSPILDFFASVGGPYYGLRGFRFDAGIYAVKYTDADEFDQADIYGGVNYEWRLADWRLKAGIHGSAGTLGSDSFDRKAGADIHAIRYLNRNSELGLSYVYDDVQDADIRYAGIDGSRQHLEARYRWYSGNRHFMVRYRQEANDRVAAEVSPTRKSLSLSYRVQLRQGWGYEAGFSYRNSRFDEMTVPRDEDLTTFSAALTRTMTNDWQLVLDYRTSKNDSNDPNFSYDRNLITVGATRVF